MKRNGRRFRRGFSRFGLRLGLVVLIVVAGFLWSSISMVSERGRRTWCHNFMKQMGLAFNLYASDHGGQNPTNITDLIKYAGGDGNASMFMCLSRNRLLTGKAPKRISEFHAAPQFVGYEYLSATSTVPNKKVSDTILPVMCDKAGNHGSDGINMLLADGHAEWWRGTLEEYGRSNSLTITINTNWVN